MDMASDTSRRHSQKTHWSFGVTNLSGLASAGWAGGVSEALDGGKGVRNDEIIITKIKEKFKKLRHAKESVLGVRVWF